MFQCMYFAYFLRANTLKKFDCWLDTLNESMTKFTKFTAGLFFFFFYPHTDDVIKIVIWILIFIRFHSLVSMNKLLLHAKPQL